MLPPRKTPNAWSRIFAWALNVFTPAVSASPIRGGTTPVAVVSSVMVLIPSVQPADQPRNPIVAPDRAQAVGTREEVHQPAAPERHRDDQRARRDRVRGPGGGNPPGGR